MKNAFSKSKLTRASWSRISWRSFRRRPTGCTIRYFHHANFETNLRIVIYLSPDLFPIPFNSNCQNKYTRSDRACSHQAVKITQFFFKRNRWKRLMIVVFLWLILQKSTFIVGFKMKSVDSYFKIDDNCCFQDPARDAGLSWAEMTDRFGGRWAIEDAVVRYCWRTYRNLLRICSMKFFTEH